MKPSKYIILIILLFAVISIFSGFQPFTVQALSGSNLSYASVGWQTDSNYSAAYGGDKAKDGAVSVASKWCSNGNSPIHWLGYDLGSYKTVNGFVVKHAGAAGEPGYMNTKYFKFQAADSWNGPWTDVTPQIDNSAQYSTTTHDITPRLMRYIRLYITNPGIDNYARIPEFEIWGNSNALNNADIQEQSSSIPSSINPGETKPVTVRVYNNGTTPWNFGSLYRLGAAATNQVGWSSFQNGGYMQNYTDGRAYLNSAQSIPPGGSWDFRFNITAPASASGTVKFSVQMVQDGVQWFGETYTWNIPVGNVLTPITKKVLVLNYDPLLENYGNIRVHQYFGWNDPRTLVNRYLTDLTECSGGYIQWQVVDFIDIDEYPVKIDGFKYNDVSYLQAWQTRTFHAPDGVDYRAIITNYNLNSRVSSGQINEVIILGAPYFGYYESQMVGQGAYFCNSPPIQYPGVPLYIIMGFNYERGGECALEDFGHRSESILTRVYGSWSPGGAINHLWDRFTRYEKIAPGLATCGNVHFPPNGGQDYDYANSSFVSSSADDWLKYPNFTGQRRSINGAEWNYDHRTYLKWWLNHMPKTAGRYSDGRLNNWWGYLVDMNAYPESGPVQ